jgi:hypothetical protein
VLTSAVVVPLAFAGWLLVVDPLSFFQSEMGEACSTYGDRSGVYRVLVGKPEGERERPFGRPRSRWEAKIKMDLRYVEWGLGLD